MKISRHIRRHVLGAQIALLAVLVACLGSIALGGSVPTRAVAVAAVVALTIVDVLHALCGLAPQTRDADLVAPEPEGQGRPSGQHEDVVVATPQVHTPCERDLAEPQTHPESSAPQGSPERPSDNAPDAPASKTPAATQRLSVPSTLDFAALSDALTHADDPIAELKRFVGAIRTREAGAATPAPCGLERYAARMLEEAGLFSSDVELPELDVVRPQASHMVYLRCLDQQLPYLARQRIIQLEAALNAIRFACASCPADASPQAAYRLNQGLARSIVAQAPALDQPLDLGEAGQWPDGEWTVRYGISQAIESLQLPYRLVARYRTNVSDGNVAIEFDHTPADVFPRSALMDGLGVVPTTGDMRQQAAADYGLRLALLLAASAFRCSKRIRHVWVAAVHDTGTHHSCYLSVDFDRWRFARLDLADLGDLDEVYRSFAPVLRHEGGWLRPVRQGFHLGEERFCPPRRYLPVSLSSQRLMGHTARSLGCDHVSGLAIEEADGRSLVATAIMMRLAPEEATDATQKNVRTVLELAADDPDPTVRSAAERVVRGLVEGSLAGDALAIGEEFVRGDALTRANDRAKELLMRQRPDEAHAALAPVLALVDEAGLYADTPTVAYRYFSSYVERALYNRLYVPSELKSVMLVPDAYFEAHLLVSTTCLMMGRTDEGLSHAQRLVTLAPLDARARLHQAQCLEAAGRDEEATAQIAELLEHGFEPQGLGFAYYRMAYFQWKRGNVAAAQACYRYAMRLLPGALPLMAMELSVLYLQNPDALQHDASEEDLAQVLADNGIPIAPTPETSAAFYDCTRASLDAEVFPVARMFARILAAFSGDDILAGVARSLEDEPDR